MATISRRTFFAASSLALAGPIVPATAAAPKIGAQGPGAYRYRLGNYELTAIYDGTWYMPIDAHFVRNAASKTVNRALAAAFLPPGVLPVSFTALLVNTGSQLVLIDTGTAGQITDTAGFMNANLATVGVNPGDIDIVLISHFHPDHIDGLKTKDGAKVFGHAEIKVPEPEWAYWMDDAHITGTSKSVHGYFVNARRIFSDIASEVTRFRPGAEVAPGIASIPAYGHTPGHTAFAINSAKESLLVMSDAVRNPYLFLRHPGWQPIFDMDGDLAVKTRRHMLDRAAADRMLVEAYHFPFPAVGHILRTRTGYELAPAMWAPL